MTFRTMKLRRDRNCPVCGDNPTIDKLIDYEQFCGIRGEESDTIIRSDGAIPEMTVQQLRDKLKAKDDFVLIDVREPHEHQICNLPAAKLIPLGTIAGRLSEFDSKRTYVVHCKMGGRSAQAVDIMRQAGLKAINVKGGILAWAREIDTSMATY